MKKMSHVDQSHAGSLQHSLSAIKEAHFQLLLLTSSSTTPTALASRIQLYDVLLGEISGIRNRLARSIKYRRSAPYACGERVGLNS